MACGTVMLTASLFAQSPAAPKPLAEAASGSSLRPLPRPPTATESIAEEVRSVFESCRKAVVRIEAVDHHGALSGTGFFIDPNGTLYTSYTVGGESRDIVVCHGTTRRPAQRIVADPRSGIAILKVDAETPFLLPAQSRALQVASPVVAIGYPMDLPPTPSFGTIGGFDIKYLGRFFATTHIRSNMSVQRGEGGAPLLNMHGEVIGILISSLDSGSASFALPIAAAEKVHKDFIRFGEIRPGWMGVNVIAASQPIEGSYAQIEGLFEGGPAQKAGLQKGDVLLQIADHKIHAVEDVLDASFFMTADDAVLIKVARDQQEIQLTLQPSDHPSSGHTLRSRPSSPLPAFGPSHLNEEKIPLKIDR
ncbi:MAG: trypsin-like peptidase domain-containing protein [Verrucomicrobiota bacterium]